MKFPNSHHRENIVPLPQVPGLPMGRLTEVCGNAATPFAAISVARTRGPVIWIVPMRGAGIPHAPGLSEFLDPARLCYVWVSTPVEGLWAAEEALRSGGAGAVILEALKVPNLTETRRLQLAAEHGRTLGLLLSPGEGGAAAATMRWKIESRPNASWDSTLWEWALIRNKIGTCGHWQVSWNAKTRSLRLVSPPGERRSYAPPGA